MFGLEIKKKTFSIFTIQNEDKKKLKVKMFPLKLLFLVCVCGVGVGGYSSCGIIR